MRIDENVVLTSEIMPNGDIINAQYENGILVETVTIKAGNDQSIFSIQYDDGHNIIKEEEIEISDFQVAMIDEGIISALDQSDTLGKIRFDTLDGLQTVKVSYERTARNQSTAVQVPSKTYTLVQLASALSVIMGIPGVVSNGLAAAFFWAAGATSLVGGWMIEGEFSALRDVYTYYLDNLTTGDFSDTLEAYHYTIVEQVKGDGKYTGDIVWDGYNPDEAWYDMGFAQEVYIHIINGLVWSVDAWL